MYVKLLFGEYLEIPPQKKLTKKWRNGIRIYVLTQRCMRGGGAVLFFTLYSKKTLGTHTWKLLTFPNFWLRNPYEIFPNEI